MDQVIVVGHDNIEVLAKTSWWTNSLLFPIYVGALSAGLFLLHAILLSNPVRQLLYPPGAHESEQDNSAQRLENEGIHLSLWGEIKENVNSNGGIVIWSFKVLRLLGVLALIGLSVASALITPQPAHESTLLDTFGKHWGKKRKGKGGKAHLSNAEWIEFAWVVFYMYSALLAFFSVILRPRLRRLATNHLVLLLLVAWSVYMWRDTWPLATVHLKPLDPQTWVTWTLIGLLSVVAVLVPLFIPHQYVPVDPAVYVSSKPNDEQTSSWFAFMCYTFLDPLVFEAARTTHLLYESLPPLADYDRAEWLAKKSFPHLDPMMGAKGHLFFGLMRYFFWDFMALVALIAVKVIVGFAGPLGIYKLLQYIENGGEGATVRPWVWISWLFIGPVVGTMAIQWYIFINTRTLVRAEGIITQLVFQHALRIRMKEEAPVTAERKPTPSEGNTVVGTPEPERATTEHRNEATSEAGVADETLQGSTSGTPSSTQTNYTQKNASQSAAASTSPSPATPATPATPAYKPAASSSTPSNLVGRINNFISTDLGNITEGRDFLFVIWYCPLQVAICVWILYSFLGMASVLGMATMVISVPLPSLVGAMVNHVQTERMKRTDARVQWVSEVMNVLRMIKLFAWEPKIKQQMLEKREEELKWIKKRQLLQLLNMNLSYGLPLVTMVVTFASYTLVFHQKLTPSRVFPSMAVFDMLRDQLHFVLWGVGAVIQAKVSIDRLSEFLNKTELLDMYDSERNTLGVEPSNAPPPDTIGFRNATFTWAKEPSGAMTPGRRNFKLKIEGELFFKPGCVNMIVGPTGCGKSSLLMALLSEMHFIPSGPDSWYNLPREGGVSYTAQESWVQNETIKENILFGAPYNEERYKKVLHQCALERDLELFEAGDETEVGEKGLTLSGGQKARVTLARAIYSQTAIILLDDVLSALDVHTGSWIVERCFKGDLVKDRTIIIVTHNISMVNKAAQYVVSLGLDGRVISQGTLTEALSRDSKLLAEVAKENEREEKEGEVIDPPEEGEKAPKKEGKLVVAEEVALGRVSWPALKLYLFSLGGGVFWVAFLGGFLLSDISTSIQTFWLGWWAKQYAVSDDVNVPYYLGVYGALLIGTMFVYCGAYAVYIYGSIRASRSIHDKLSDSVLGTTLRWLDLTPVGRVISRFTMDMRAVDGPIASYLSDFVELTITLLVKLCAVIYMSPIFAIPGAIVFGLGSWLGNQYIKAQLSVKREMSNARSPLFSHFNAAIAGLTSIRAYGAQEAFKQQTMQRIDKYTRSARTFYNLNRWVCIRIDALGGAFAAGLGAYVIYGRDMSSNDAGFSLTMAVAFSGMILWWVRVGNEFEVACNSLERIESYIQCEQEPKPTESGKPPAYWPSTGALVIEKLKASYSVDGSEVLHDLTLEIKSGERIGVVGRTGSGKSSLTLALLRLIPTKGAVMYDGIVTENINLNALRTNMTIIPQQPELLSGTIRENLDPFGEYDDATLNDALRASGLYNVQSEDEDSRITLDTAVSSGGGNFSLGQRQIMALARAICRRSKVLILDEATAAIDHDTDALIQASIRNELKDITVITVAHRLKTIGDCDRIIVLDAGHLAEFDTPANLLKNENGFFRSLVDNSGDREELYRMAGAKI